MLKTLYTIGIYLTQVVIPFLALFNSKLKQGVIGRKQTFQLLKNSITASDKVLWFHCASLGEFEQGFPVFEVLTREYPHYKVVLSFFSPSGYNIKKQSNIADIVVYLPLDTPQNAKQFLDYVHPNLTVFVKYDIWPNILIELKKRRLKAVLISALFRKNQIYFKWYGHFMKSSLFAFHYIFTQDEYSKKALKDIGYQSVSISGDTRFDRVYQQLNRNNHIDFIKAFKAKSLCVVLGSTWPEDDKLFIDFINKNASENLKFIIAPHHISANYIKQLKQQIKKEIVCFSEQSKHKLSTFNVFVLDTIGYLSRAYCYADIAYVGGAAGKTGLHNILEAAVFGIPIIIGKNHDKFPEATALIKRQGLVSATHKKEFEIYINFLIKNEKERQRKGIINKIFIEENRGALKQIMNYIKTNKL